MSWAAELASPLCSAVTALRREVAEIEINSARGQHCARTTLAVAVLTASVQQEATIDRDDTSGHVA